MTRALTFLAFLGVSLALPEPNSQARPIFVPKPIAYSGPKHIPDRQHPFIAPGPDDQRGPCPALNTLANHGYLPRNGIATFADLVTASQEGLSFDYNFSLLAAGIGMLTRGNPFTNQLSIGGLSERIPSLPKNMDGGCRPGGMGKHGRFEGDSSMGHDDFGITGDDHSFSATQFSKLVDMTHQFGDENGTVVNLKTLQELKWELWQDSQKRNPTFSISPFRRKFMYGQAAFVIELFANGTDKRSTLDSLFSFFRDNRFPPNFFRRPVPFSFLEVGQVGGTILAAHPTPVGHNDESGNFVVEEPESTGNPLCDIFIAMLDNVPSSFANATGQLKKNVDTLITALHAPIPEECPIGKPTGLDETSC